MTDSENSTEYQNETGGGGDDYQDESIEHMVNTIGLLRPKTAAERMREYRARKRNKSKAESEDFSNIKRKTPKTVAERSREYRARRKNKTQTASDPSAFVHYDDDNINANDNIENVPEFIECGSSMEFEELDIEDDAHHQNFSLNIASNQDPSFLCLKRAAERMQEYSAEKSNRNPTPSDLSSIERKPPKTVAERLREYRVRKKNKIAGPSDDSSTIFREDDIGIRKANGNIENVTEFDELEVSIKHENEIDLGIDEVTIVPEFSGSEVLIKQEKEIDLVVHKVENVPEFSQSEISIKQEKEIDLSVDEAENVPQLTESENLMKYETEIDLGVDEILAVSELVESGISIKQEEEIDLVDDEAENVPGLSESEIPIKQEKEIDLVVDEAKNVSELAESEDLMKYETEIDLGVDEILTISELVESGISIKQEEEIDLVNDGAENVPGLSESEIPIKQEKEIDLVVDEAKNVSELAESEDLMKYGTEIDLGVDEILTVSELVESGISMKQEEEIDLVNDEAENVPGFSESEIPIKQEKEIDLVVDEAKNASELAESEDLKKYETEIDLGVDEIREVLQSTKSAKKNSIYLSHLPDVASNEIRNKSVNNSLYQAGSVREKLGLQSDLPSASLSDNNVLEVNKNLVKFINSRKVLTVFTFNCQSLRAQSNDQNYLIVKNPNILVLSDIRLGDEDEKSFPNFNCIVKFKEPNSSTDDVKIFRHSEEVLKILTPSIDFSITDSNLHNSIVSKVGELCIARGQTKNRQNIIIAALYISPNQKLDEIIFFLYRSLLPYTLGGATLLRNENNKIPMILSGDFKVNFVSAKSTRLIEFLKEKFQLCLECNPQSSTIKSKTLIGAVFTRFLDQVECRTYTVYFSYPNLLVRNNVDE